MSCSVNTTVTNISNCSVAEEITTFAYFRTAVIFESIFGGYAFVSNIFLLAIGWRVSVFPPNLRLLLGHVSLVLAWFGLGGLVKGVYLLYNEPCDLSITQRRCRIFEVITTNAALVPMFFGLTALCVERIYATIRFRGYDLAAGIQKPYLAIGSILLIWASSMGMNFYNFSCINENNYMAICDSSVFLSGSILAPYYIFYLSLETLAVVATIFVHFYNRYLLRNMVINRALYDLSSRFQVDQNVQVNTVMMPSMILHLFCFLPNYALMLMFLDMGPKEKATFVHVSYLWREVYAGAHPTLAFFLNSQIKQKLSRNFVGHFLSKIGFHIEKSSKTTDTTTRSRVEREAHFKHLEDLWSTQRTTVFRHRIKKCDPPIRESSM